MGERKGVNKYYPPDYDPSKGGLNKFQGTHALRERARKLHMGILIIRFEMPYNIWCEGCNNHIGTGVRYNAEKKKVGMYYSTPIYQFRMKCHLCDNHFEIKTDPANLDYEIVSGARRQERRWDPTENEQVVPEDKDVSRKMATDAMYKLEHGVQDKAKSHELDPTIERLEEFQSSRWHDDYASNRKLRESMRAKRDEAKAQAVKDASYHLSVPLLPPNEEDEKVAKLLQFTQAKSSERLKEERRALIDAESVFAKLKPKKVSKETKKAVARKSLHHIITNSQKNFSSFKNSYGTQGLGIVHKKNRLPDSTNEKIVENMKPKVDGVSATFSENEVFTPEKTGENSSTTSGSNSLSDVSEDTIEVEQSGGSEANDMVNQLHKNNNGGSENSLSPRVISSDEKEGGCTTVSPKPILCSSSKSSDNLEGSSQVSLVNVSLGSLVNYDSSGSDEL